MAPAKKARTPLPTSRPREYSGSDSPPSSPPADTGAGSSANAGLRECQNCGLFKNKGHFLPYWSKGNRVQYCNYCRIKVTHLERRHRMRLRHRQVKERKEDEREEEEEKVQQPSTTPVCPHPLSFPCVLCR